MLHMYAAISDKNCVNTLVSERRSILCWSRRKKQIWRGENKALLLEMLPWDLKDAFACHR